MTSHTLDFFSRCYITWFVHLIKSSVWEIKCRDIKCVRILKSSVSFSSVHLIRRSRVTRFFMRFTHYFFPHSIHNQVYESKKIMCNESSIQKLKIKCTQCKKSDVWMCLVSSVHLIRRTRDTRFFCEIHLILFSLTRSTIKCVKAKKIMCNESSVWKLKKIMCTESSVWNLKNHGKKSCVLNQV